MAIKIQNETVIYDDKTVKFGVGTTAERPASPVQGMLRYNSTLSSFEGYSNNSWVSIGTAPSLALSGSSSVNENSTNTYIITSYSDFKTYSVSVSSGTVSRTGDTITFIAPTVSADTVVTLTITLDNVSYNFSITVLNIISGEQVYTSPGTYSWVAPADVASVSVVAVGAGGAGGGSGVGYGGGGGGLGWKNNIAVTAGQSYTVVVGAGTYTSNATAGENSYFINLSTVAGYGGKNNSGGGGGGTYTGTGGGNGGSASAASGGAYPGGGAGGYSGNGGNGVASSSGLSGSGGGGGGGTSAYGGGGVGLYGEGTSGAGGVTGSPSGKGGSGGSNSPNTGDGGLYGGGSGTANYGAVGAVRIIWGPNRSFPSNAA